MDEVEIVPFDPRWPLLYEEERSRLMPLLRPFGLVRIAHVGSTAVPGLAAKPVIDIAATVIAFETARREAVIPLSQAGYQFWADNPDPGELFFVKGLSPSAPRRTHHLHLTEPGDGFDLRIRFRNLLRSDSALARRYAALKEKLSGEYRNDREAYTAAKTAFIAGALAA